MLVRCKVVHLSPTISTVSSTSLLGVQHYEINTSDYTVHNYEMEGLNLNKFIEISYH